MRNIKGQFESNALFRFLFPEILPDRSCVWKGDALQVKRSRSLEEATFEAAGIRTAVVSRHYDLIIEDDTVAPEKEDIKEEVAIPSAEDIACAIGWHKLAYFLMIDLRESMRLVVGTRWAERDLLSYIDERGDFTSYQRSALEDENGESDPGGEPPYPERFPMEVVEDVKRSVGPYLFACLYLNTPLRSEDMVFDPAWFRYYDIVPPNLVVYTTVDPAGDPEHNKGKTCYNVVMTCGKSITSGLVYVLDYWRKKANPGELIDAIFDHVDKYSPVVVGVESVAYQGTLQYWIEERQRKTKQYFFINPIIHGGNTRKAARIMGLQPLVYSGTLKFQMWMKELVSEMIAYPLGAYKDAVDALSMQPELWDHTVSTVERQQKLRKGNGLDFVDGVRELVERRLAELDSNTPMGLIKHSRGESPEHFKAKYSDILG